MKRKRGLQLDNPIAAGRHLAELRAERGFNQTELANQLGISQSLISQYEKGELRLNSAMIAGLVRVLGISADELLGLQTDKANGKKPPRRFLRRLEQIEALPKRKQEALIQTIDAFLMASQA